MIIALLSVSMTNKDWPKNILNNKPTKVNYWTNGWTPDERNITEVHIWFNGELLLKGDYMGSYKDTVKNVFQKEAKTSNGLNNVDSLDHFKNIVDKEGWDNEIGNIVIGNIDYLPDPKHISYKERPNQRIRYVRNIAGSVSSKT